MFHLDLIERGFVLVRKRYGAEQIINRLREVELMVSNGSTVGEACKKIGVSRALREPYEAVFFCGV